MCLPGCKEAVHRAVSRRGLFVGLGATGATLVATRSTPAAAVRPARFSRVVDLTHTLSEDFPTFFGPPGITVTKKLDFAKDGYNLNEWTVTEHVGTHLDAPIHFSADGKTAEELEVEDLVAPLVVIDVTAKAEDDPDYQLSEDDVLAFEEKNGRIPAGACVAMLSGWGEHVKTDKFRNADAEGVMHFPGFDPELAKLLFDREVIGVAVDTLSLDHGASPDFAFHAAWLGSGRWGLEAVANLGDVPATGATIVVGAPKIKGATGGPARILALA